jgi:hypothetical protein
MNRKLLLPTLAIALAILACNLQTGTTASPPPSITVTDTPIPPLTTTSTPSLPTPLLSSNGLTVNLLRNGTYYAPVYGHTVTLINGAYSENTSSGVYTVQMLDVYAFGDLNGDGVGDAAIILVENDGGTGQFESVIAVYNSGGSPVQAGLSQLGDRVQVNSMDISSGVIHLNMLVQGPNDPMCCPTLAEKQSYWMIAGHLWLMRVTTTNSGAERSININSPANWADVTNPFTVTGAVPISPFENTLAYHIYLPDETKVNDSSLLVSSSGMGTPGTFSQAFNLSMAEITGYVIIQFVDVSAADGSTLAMGSVLVKVH